MEYAFLWIAFAVVVGVAANARGRDGLGWFFLALIISPLIALLLVLVMNRRSAESVGTVVFEKEARAANDARPYIVTAIAVIIGGVIFLAPKEKETKTAAPTEVQQSEPRNSYSSSVASITAAPSASSYSRGLAALDRGDFDAAIVEFTAAMGNDPADSFPYLKRATAYEKTGDRESAISDYRKALKLVDGESRGEINATIRRLGGKP